jgi:hypothetical protein
MISSVTIQGYRGFERFQLNGLGRLSLLVGTNNSGKTSVLESIFLLASSGNPAALWQVLWRRGERLVVELVSGPLASRTEADVRHLFRGHEIHRGSSLAVSAADQTSLCSVAFQVLETPWNPIAAFPGTVDSEGAPLPGSSLHVDGHPEPAMKWIPLSPTGGLSETLEIPRRSRQAGDTPIFVGLWIMPDNASE